MNWCELNPSCKEEYDLEQRELNRKLKLHLKECELNDFTLYPQFQCPGMKSCGGYTFIIDLSKQLTQWAQLTLGPCSQLTLWTIVA